MVKRIFFQFPPNFAMIAFQSHRNYEFGNNENNQVYVEKRKIFSSSCTPCIEYLGSSEAYIYVRGEHGEDDYTLMNVTDNEQKIIAKMANDYNSMFN